MVESPSDCQRDAAAPGSSSASRTSPRRRRLGSPPRFRRAGRSDRRRISAHLKFKFLYIFIFNEIGAKFRISSRPACPSRRTGRFSPAAPSHETARQFPRPRQAASQPVQGWANAARRRKARRRRRHSSTRNRDALPRQGRREDPAIPARNVRGAMDGMRPDTRPGRRSLASGASPDMRSRAMQRRSVDIAPAEDDLPGQVFNLGGEKNAGGSRDCSFHDRIPTHRAGPCPATRALRRGLAAGPAPTPSSEKGFSQQASRRRSRS